MNFDDYLLQLEAIADILPRVAYEYAGDSTHYDLASHSSLHDAWLEHVTIKEVSSGQRDQVRATEIELCFLGPFHDRRLVLVYGGVLNYRVWSNSGTAGHGDLASHEFKASEQKTPLHELRFHGDAAISIEFLEFAYREEEIGNQ